MAWATRPNAEDDIDTAGLDAHREHATSKLDAMESYAQSFTCLRRRILDYFGDDAIMACGNCGPCLAPPARARSATTDTAEAELFQALRALRRQFAEEANVPPFTIFSDATLHEMARRRPRNRAEMLSVSGVGSVKLERYGEAFLAVTRAANGRQAAANGSGAYGVVRSPAPGSLRASATHGRNGRVLHGTVRRTYELWRDGRAIDEIAQQRGLSPSTIAQHLADLVAAAEIDDVREWVDDITLGKIRRMADGGLVGPLGPIKESLGDSVSYEQLQLARAYLNREREKAPA
jgi:ATP-dependent DNA helicase RecQ